MTKVFIDGSSGTTGLQVKERLSLRSDIELIEIPEELKKTEEGKRMAFEQADIAFFCLPDDAAKETAKLAEEYNVKVIDTSTAHRTAEGWVYGMPELMGVDAVKNSKKIANPGCHASGFIVLVQPLVKAGLISPDTALTCTSLTGYSGGGKKMIAQYEEEGHSVLLDAPRQYGITQQHKHLKEMAAVCGLTVTPIFMPIVDDFFSGMEVTVPLFKKDLKGSVEDIKKVYRDLYDGPVINFVDEDPEGGFLSAGALSGKDSMTVSVYGNEERILLVSRFDNLGKGACGAAIQNMNILIGADQTKGLNL